jgi:hypothetical protein
MQVALATSHAQAGIMEGQLRSMARSLELSAESRALAEKKVATLMMDVVAAKVGVGRQLQAIQLRLRLSYRRCDT